MKDVLWGCLLKFDVPHQGNAIWLMRSIFVVVVGSHQQLRILEEVVEEAEEEEEVVKTAYHILF